MKLPLSCFTPRLFSLSRFSFASYQWVVGVGSAGFSNCVELVGADSFPASGMSVDAFVASFILTSRDLSAGAALASGVGEASGA